jgi:hypothetical protein
MNREQRAEIRDRLAAAYADGWSLGRNQSSLAAA